MARMATVKVLRRHSNDYDGVMSKVPEGDVREGETALTSYAMPLGVAQRHEREGLVEITDVEPDPDAELEAKPAAPKKPAKPKPE